MPRRRGAGGCSTWSPLQGLLAHHRGEWFQRLRVELRTGEHRPTSPVAVFDAHLCVAEYLLYGPTPYDEVLELAGDLRDTAERAGVLRAVAFAMALTGEAALLSGDLDLAEPSCSTPPTCTTTSGRRPARPTPCSASPRCGWRAATAPRRTGLLQRALPLGPLVEHRPAPAAAHLRLA